VGIAVAALLAAAALLGGCGGGSSSSTPAQDNPMPSLSALSPASGTSGGAAFTLTVTGSSFVSNSVIEWNGSALSTSFSSATQLSAQVPAGDLTSSGSASVTVVSPAPGGGTSSALSFAINNPMPTLTSIAPSSVTAGSSTFTLTVTGTKFVSGAVVDWNGTALTTIYSSATQLTAQIPASDVTSTGTASVSVVNPTPGGGSSGTATLTIGAAGALSLSPQIVPLTSQQSQLFTASLSGGGSLSTSWSVDGVAGGNSTVGTITASGTANEYTYTPGSAVGTHTITATNTANTSQSASASAAVTSLAGVYTYHNDLARTGQNLQEYALTTANVSGGNFGKLWSCPVDSDIYAQPLYVANLSISGGVHNVLFIATMHNSVYAFDADSPSCLTYWHVNLTPSGASTISPNAANCFDALIEYGITGTPVIDPSSGTLFLVAATTESGSYIQRLHALSLASGAERTNSPALISLSGGNTPYSALINNQRAGLLLSDGQVYIGWASHCDVGPYSGWLASYNESTLAQTSVLDVTPNKVGGEGGIWMSGGAPAVDSSGSIYLTTGNGDFSDTGDVMPGLPNYDFSMSVLRLDPATLAVPDFFTPTQWSGWSAGDLDISAAGVTLLPDGMGPSAHPNLLVTSDKGGRLYLIDRADMSGYTVTGNDPVQMTAVPNQATCNSAVCTFSTPAYYNGTVYLGQTKGAVVAMPLSNGVFELNASTGTAMASSQSAESYSYPSPTPQISATPSGNAILWVLDTNANGTKSNNGSGNAWPTGPAILRAYDATNLGSTLYSSSAKSADAAGNAIKFSVPVIANGHVYVGGSKVLTVYGLLN
jgi:hypothetical protein